MENNLFIYLYFLNKNTVGVSEIPTKIIIIFYSRVEIFSIM